MKGGFSNDIVCYLYDPLFYNDIMYSWLLTLSGRRYIVVREIKCSLPRPKSYKKIWFTARGEENSLLSFQTYEIIFDCNTTH